MTDPPTHIIEVWGDFACFSRPELKVERWSYPCPTPSAARGVFDAIYCKPKGSPGKGENQQAEFRWQITKIELLALPTYIALRRNEVADVISTRNATTWMNGKGEPAPYLVDDGNNRQQRQTMALRNVRFRLHGHIVPWPGFENHQAAFDEQFLRRARHGKCFQQPYLGCREFVCFYRLVEDIASEPPPVPFTQDIGFMVYDVFDLSKPGSNESKAHVSLFPAEIQNGVLEIPAYDDPSVRKPERRAS